MTEQPSPPSTGARLHALDNLRAILMWLGIVLHVDAIYASLPMPNPWRDDQRTVVADLMIGSIHAFRMPAFFILAGFFAAMLAVSRGPEGMWRHRMARLALPFALFWPVLWLATMIASHIFLNRIRLGQWAWDSEAMVQLQFLGPPSTIHLWFLWMLAWMCTAAAVAMRLPREWFTPLANGWVWLARQPWSVVVLAMPLLAASLGYPRAVLVPSNAFLPTWNEWVYYGVFFVFGLALYGRHALIFDQLQRRWWAYALGGLLCYLAAMAAHTWIGDRWTSLAYNAVAWLWSFAAIGMALRFLASRHAVLGYLADSAYWVYLVHFPFTILFGAWLYQMPLPALVKIAINIVCTTAVCLGSYELLARHTWVSQLLNGKRHPRRVHRSPSTPDVA